ncbi:hypothetical protein B0A55_13111 [Friedmanniomyces simplex]|uniref:Uncharacterized protein n=1 Tax=Friedmanniomyces simplex TaxID=329884 RepID=A0A4U0VJT8_9PEZI|nr:hypothetical protein B0A55_13111 [Friedmanniomyces simplex]
MKRFIEEVRQRWDPDPPEEWEPRGEGYTDEGALTLCVYQLAFQEDPEGQGQVCEAEEMNQVLLHPPVDALVDKIPKPLADPAPQGEVEKKQVSLGAQLQVQFDQSAAANTESIHLPDGFNELMSVTNGMHGAGLLAETAHTVLVYPLDRHHAEPEMLTFISPWVESRDFTALAAWKVGSCQQHRQIYYVFCHKNGDDSAVNASWRIFDRADVQCDIYENLARFLQHETADVEERPGGAQQEHIVAQSSHPL